MIDTLTIVGRVATDPTQSQTGGGVPVTNFRLASTHRRFDVVTRDWIDSGTNWFSVAAFRQLGENVKASLRTGDSVIVTGRLKIREWESNGKHGTSIDIEADAVGHDLRWGTTVYRPRPHPSHVEPEVQTRLTQEPVSEPSDNSRAIEEGDQGSAALGLSWSMPALVAEATQ